MFYLGNWDNAFQASSSSLILWSKFLTVTTPNSENDTGVIALLHTTFVSLIAQYLCRTSANLNKVTQTVNSLICRCTLVKGRGQLQVSF